MRILFVALISGVTIAMTACSPATEYDIIIRNGAIYDGSGGDPMVGDVAIQGDTLAAIGPLARRSSPFTIHHSPSTIHAPYHDHRR